MVWWPQLLCCRTQRALMAAFDLPDLHPAGVCFHRLNNSQLKAQAALLACSAVQLDQGQYEALEALHPAWSVVIQHVPTSSYLW